MKCGRVKKKYCSVDEPPYKMSHSLRCLEEENMFREKVCMRDDAGQLCV